MKKVDLDVSEVAGYVARHHAKKAGEPVEIFKEGRKYAKLYYTSPINPKCNRASRLIIALIATIFSVFFALVSKKIRTFWKEGCSGRELLWIYFSIDKPSAEDLKRGLTNSAESKTSLLLLMEKVEGSSAMDLGSPTTSPTIPHINLDFPLLNPKSPTRFIPRAVSSPQLTPGCTTTSTRTLFSPSPVLPFPIPQSPVPITIDFSSTVSPIIEQMSQDVAKLLAMTNEEVKKAGAQNLFDYDLESLPYLNLGSDSTLHFIALLQSLPSDKAANFLAGLISHPQCSEKFMVYCLRIAEEVRFRGHQSGKMNTLFKALFQCLADSNKLGDFWDKAMNIAESDRNDHEESKPIFAAMFAFYDANVIFSIKDQRDDLLKIVVDRGSQFGLMRFSNDKQKNPILEAKLTWAEKQHLISVLKQVNAAFYKDVVFVSEDELLQNLSAKSPEELFKENQNNTHGFYLGEEIHGPDFEPSFLNDIIKDHPLLTVLDKLSSKKAEALLRGLLHNPKVEIPFYVFCIKLINGNFNLNSKPDDCSSKQVHLFRAVYSALAERDSLEIFWEELHQYWEGGSKKIENAFHVFFSVTIILALKSETDQTILISKLLTNIHRCADKCIPTEKNSNKLLENYLKDNQKQKLIEIAKSITGPWTFHNAAFPTPTTEVDSLI